MENLTLPQTEANRRISHLPGDPRSLPPAPDALPAAPLKSSIKPKACVIPGEDPVDLEAMVAGYHEDWRPTTYLERFLVDSLIRADWLLQRLSRLEAELWAHHIEDARSSSFDKLDEKAPIGDVYGRNYERFTRLQRRIDSTERSYYRALTQLQRLRRGPAPAGDSPVLAPSESPAVDSRTESPSLVPQEAPAKLASFHQAGRAFACPCPPTFAEKSYRRKESLPSPDVRPAVRATAP
jgi:hypothetical protein